MHKLFFDIESTGPDAAKDRIIQLAIKVIDDEGNVVLSKSKLYNPEMKISKAASDIHGIKDADVKNAPTFKEDARKLKKLFADKIIITYNGMRFDVPMLVNEFERAGVDIDFSGKFYDVLKIERKLAPNTLGEVYKRYTGEDLESAHDALVDVNATDIVLQHQLKKVSSMLQPNETIEEALIRLSGTDNMADIHGKLGYDSEGFLVFKFGKEIDKRIIDRTDYASWILNSNFPKQVKDMIRAEQTKQLTKKDSTQAATQTSFYPARKPSNNDAPSPLFTGAPVDRWGNAKVIDDLPF